MSTNASNDRLLHKFPYLPLRLQKDLSILVDAQLQLLNKHLNHSTRDDLLITLIYQDEGKLNSKGMSLRMFV